MTSRRGILGAEVTMAERVFERPAGRAEELGGKPGVVRFLHVPARRYVLIDGEGPPGEATFSPRMPGLYGTAFPLRFALKRRGVDARVQPLEGLWWTVGDSDDLDAILGGTRADWRWTLLIALPDEATESELDEALARGRAKVRAPYDATLRIERFEEGRAAQILHVGSYADERPSIERLHAAIGSAGLHPHGRHHEIYLGDPSRTATARLRTLLRMPVR